MRKIITICIIGLFALNVQAQPVKTLKLSDKELLDKIKGGWAGQTIGVVFGAPTEFKFTGTYIQDYQPIPWAEGYVKYWWEKKPGLFDDIYNDCTFVEAFDELGLDCSQEELAGFSQKTESGFLRRGGSSCMRTCWQPFGCES